MDVSPTDRDLMVRTVLGEADDQSPQGQAAVAHVIMNRVNDGSFGRTPSDVVLAKGQFEPWATRARQLLAIDRKSPAYDQASTIVDGVLSGDIPDPTGGATHFLNPDIVRARRKGSLPDWAQGASVKIGDHAFYAPGNPDYGKPVSALGAIQAAIGEPSAPSGKALAFTDEPAAGVAPAAPGSLFRAAGFDVPQAAPQGAPAQSAAPSAPGSLFRDAGFTVPAGSAAAPAAPVIPDWAKARGAVDFIRIPGTESQAPTYIDAAGKVVSPPDANQGVGSNVPTPLGLARSAAVNTAADTIEAAKAGAALTSSGLSDIRNANYFPTMPGVDPRTWTAGGLLKTGAGAMGVLTSPLTGASQALVADPVTQLTGNPDIGDRAGFLATLALPSKGGATAVKAASPGNQAVNRLVNAVGPENVPAAVARMRSNPALTVMDVSEPVRAMAQGLIDPAQPKAQQILTSRVKERIAGAPDAVNAAYTDSMGPAPNVVQMVDALKERARAAGREAIAPALENAKPVDVSPVLQEIDATLKPGAQAFAQSGLPLSPLQEELARFKQQLVNPETGETLTDPARLHDVQSRMGDMAYQLTLSPDPKQRMLGAQLRDFNEKLIDQIDAASGGTYRPARAKFKDAKGISEAFEAGFDTLKNRSGVSGLEDRPEAFKAWMDNATPEMVVARRLGTRADIDQKINGVKNAARAGIDIPQIPYNQQKLSMLFGDEEANRLVTAMNDARDQATTNAKLLAGSKTAETLAGQKALAVRQVGGSNPLRFLPPVAAEMLGQGAGLPFVGALSTMALGGLHRGAQKIGQVHDLARNAAFADYASAAGDARSALMDAMMSHPKVVSQLKKSGNALTVP